MAPGSRSGKNGEEKKVFIARFFSSRFFLVISHWNYLCGVAWFLNYSCIRKGAKVFHHLFSIAKARAKAKAKKSRREQSLLILQLFFRNKQRKVSAKEIISRLILILVSVSCLLLPLNLTFLLFFSRPPHLDIIWVTTLRSWSSWRSSARVPFHYGSRVSFRHQRKHRRNAIEWRWNVVNGHHGKQTIWRFHVMFKFAWGSRSRYQIAFY